MTQSYGAILDPYRRLKEPLGVKGNRQSIVITNNPSTIDAGQILTVTFPNLGQDDVIIPGTVRLAFKIDLESDTDANRTVVANLGRAIVKKITIKLEGREVFSLNNADVFLIYSDLWLTTNERNDLVYQGIQGGNGLRHRVGAGDAKDDNKDAAVALAYGNRFYIPLDFELLNTHLPYYQGALKDRLSYELTFNEYKRVIRSVDTDAKYRVYDISLEFDVVHHAELARLIAQRYETRLPIYYERVLNHSAKQRSKADTVWNFNFNTPARSFKGILMLFEDVKKPYNRMSEKFYNPNILELTCTIEGVPNQVYASGFRPYQHFGEVQKFFAGGRQRDPVADLASKSLHLHDVRLENYLMANYGLWLDLRTTEDNKLHGSGRRIENGSEGITIQISKKAGADEPVMIYLFVVSDAQLNIENNRFKDVVY